MNTDAATQIWACGRTMHSLMHLFVEQDVTDCKWDNLENTTPLLSDECTRLYPSAMTDIVMDCLHPWPQDRISSQDLFDRVDAEVEKFKEESKTHVESEEGSGEEDGAVDETKAASRILLTSKLRYDMSKHLDWA